MSRYRIQYKDKPVTVGGIILSPYTFFINEQAVMTAYLAADEIKADKAGRAYLSIQILLSDNGRGFWYRGVLYDNGRVAYIDDAKQFRRLRGLYQGVYDGFISKMASTERRVAPVRHDYDDDAAEFGAIPTMRQPQRADDIVRYKDTRYQINKLSSSYDGSKDFNENRSTNSPLYWWTLENEGHGKTTRSCAKTKRKDYTPKTPVYAGKSKTAKRKVRSEYLSQFNEEDWAEVIFRDAMLALRDDFA